MTDPNLSPDTPRDDVAPPPSTPTATPKAPPPPLMGRAPRPGAVRIRKLVVQGAVMVPATPSSAEEASLRYRPE